LFSAVLSELDTRESPYEDIMTKGIGDKKVSGGTLMHLIGYENLHPSLSTGCMDSVRDIFERCTSDDQSQRPTFDEIVQFLENEVRQDTLKHVRLLGHTLHGLH
jgi:hypothetical protein